MSAMCVFRKILLAAFCVLAFAFPQEALAKKIRLLNVSYDPTREFYHEYNKQFSDYWEKQSGDEVVVRQSHGGSGKQARSIIMGLRGDVLTLALAHDINMVAKLTGKIPANWQQKLPHNSSPFTSTIVFLVREGNPKNIKDWDDLIRPDVAVITPNPKTSGGARWNYLAAWAYALDRYPDDEKQAIGFLKKLYANVPVFDAGARGSTTTFAQRHIGDVLVTWENEAHLAIEQLKESKLQIVVPSISVLAEPPVAVIEENARKNGTLEVAKSYLARLYEKDAQALAMKHFYRPRDLTLLYTRRDLFPQVPMRSIQSFGGWHAVETKHFEDGAIFDQVTRRD